MEWLKDNGDRFALLMVSLVAIIVSGLMIAKSFSFADDFVYEHVTGDARGREVPETGADSVAQSSEAIEQDVMWKLPVISGIQVPIFKSVVLIQKGNQIYNVLKTGSPALRPPMTNAFLVEYHLDYTRTDVDSLDPDEDGFSNLEEFVGVNGVSTDPTDQNDRPPLTNKLYVKERIEIPYVIIFSSNSGDLYQVGEKKDGGRMNRLFVKKDAQFFDRFTVLGFRNETMFDDRINVEREMGILTVQDNTSGEKIDLIQGREYNLPSFIGVFLYTWKVDMEIPVKKGEMFKIQGDLRDFKLVEILESEAVIVPCDDKGVAIEGALKIRIPSLVTRGSINSGTAPVPPAGAPLTPPDRPLRLPPGTAPDGTAPTTPPVGTDPPTPPAGTAPVTPPVGAVPPTPPPAGTTPPTPPAGTTPAPPAGTTDPIVPPAPPAGTTPPTPPAGTTPPTPPARTTPIAPPAGTTPPAASGGGIVPTAPGAGAFSGTP